MSEQSTVAFTEEDSLLGRRRLAFRISSVFHGEIFDSNASRLPFTSRAELYEAPKDMAVAIKVILRLRKWLPIVHLGFVRCIAVSPSFDF